MKKILLASAAAVAIAAPAQAADLPVKAPPAVTVAVFSWTGCHLGASGGYNWGRSSTTTTMTNSPAPFATPADTVIYQNTMSPTLSPRGGIVGGQIGCDVQNGRFVVGVETDFSWFRVRDSAVTFGDPGPGSSDLTSRTEISTRWLWTGRARAGFAVDRALFYATGGIAVTRLSYSQSNFFTPCGPNVCTENVAISPTKAGWTVGGGIEYAVTNNWSIKGEYLHTRFGRISTTGTPLVGGVPFASQFNHTADLRVNTVRGGINYRWGG